MCEFAKLLAAKRSVVLKHSVNDKTVVGRKSVRITFWPA